MIKKETPLKTVLKLGERCGQCAHCCRHGSGILAGNDAKNIAEFLGISEDQLKAKYLEEIEIFHTKVLRPKFKKPFGKCVFLRNNDCMIHEVKPLQCKVCKGCGELSWSLSEWFKLNYLVNPYDSESIRQWASYLEDNDTIEGGSLLDLVSKERLSRILKWEE